MESVVSQQWNWFMETTAPAGGLLGLMTSSSGWILVLSVSQENIHADRLVLFCVFVLYVCLCEMSISFLTSSNSEN